VAESRSALEILRAPDDWSPPPSAVIALVGDEPFLAGELLRLIRGHLVPDEADRSWAWREFDGDSIEDPRDIFDEAATVPMFAGATRVAVVRSADPFVTKCRATLETLGASPRGHRGLVILDVKTFPATTRLAKALAAQNAVIDLAVPSKIDLAVWLRHWARARHGCVLEAATAQRLLERLNNELGQIDQAVQRLAGAQGKGGKAIPPEAIDDMVGSAQERSAWGMVDAAAAGNAPEALSALADLLANGENPIALFAQAATSLRRLAAAARLLGLPPGAGRPGSFDEALKSAGVAAWPKALAQARESLQQLGGRRARQLPQRLADLDRSLKGDASRGLRARLALERLICMMARQSPGSDAPAGRPGSSAAATSGSGRGTGSRTGNTGNGTRRTPT
jgi:DNA polymerase-3 subunit delta